MSYCLGVYRGNVFEPLEVSVFDLNDETISHIVIPMLRENQDLQLSRVSDGEVVVPDDLRYESGMYEVEFRRGRIRQAKIFGDTPNSYKNLSIWTLDLGPGLHIDLRADPRFQFIKSVIEGVCPPLRNLLERVSIKVIDIFPIIFGGLVRDLIQHRNLEHISDVDVYLYLPQFKMRSRGLRVLKSMLSHALSYDEGSWTTGDAQNRGRPENDDYHVCSFKVNGLKFDIVIGNEYYRGFDKWSMISSDCTVNTLAMTLDGDIFVRPNRDGYTIDDCIRHIEQRLIVPTSGWVHDYRIEKMRARGYRVPPQKHPRSSGDEDVEYPSTKRHIE